MRLVCFAIFASVLLCIGAHAQAQTLFSEDFQDGDADGWSAGGDGTVQVTNYQGNYSLQLTKKAVAIIGLQVSGPESVAISVAFAALDLEKNDFCIAEASNDNGASWQELHRVEDGQDDGVTLSVGGGRVETPENSPLFLRLRVAGNGDNDTCWADNIRVSAVRRQSSAIGAGPREELTAEFLLGDSAFERPASMRAFDKAIDAAPPSIALEGRLRFSPVKDDARISVVRDNFNFTVNVLDGLTHPPAFDLAFVAAGDRIVPTERGLIRTESLAWDLIVDVGRVWREPDDGAYSRAAIPFALQERNANCTHNGVITFVYNAEGDVSRAAYQISSETCFYFQYDMWGIADVAYLPEEVGNAQAVRDNYLQEVAARISSKPVSALAEDHPGLDRSAFAAPENISPEHLTTFGLVVDGVHYRGGCETRYGPYPFCDEIALPSYSTSKSIFAGLALMRLEHLHPGAFDALIEDYVPECKNAGWRGVTFGHALDMATGRYNETGGEADENAAVQDGFFIVDSHQEKIERACTIYPRKQAPGERWVYHTTDHYVLGTAMQAFLRQRTGVSSDIYDNLLVDPVWRALDLSPVAYKTRRTRDDIAQPYVGWGLTFLPDDLAKLAAFFRGSGGVVDGQTLLDKEEFAASMQLDARDRGLPAPTEAFRYNNGVWAWNAGAAAGCEESLWAPFMSGFGGVSVVMMPNDMIYYYVSDNAEFVWAPAIAAANAYLPMCGAAP